MLPVLFSVGSFDMYSYGLFIVLGFFAALAVLIKNGLREKVRGDHLVDMSFLALIGGLIGARTLFVVTQWEIFVLTFMLEDQTKRTVFTFLGEIFSFWNGGFVFYGGLIAGITVFVLRAKTLKLPIFKTLDLAAPALALGHSIGRIGCFLAGCCFGRDCPADSPLAVVFSHPDSLAPLSVPLYPTQLFDLANALIVFVILQKFVSRRKFDGQILALYLIFYGIGRIMVESFRGDDVRGFLFGGTLSTSQFISIIALLGGVLVYRIRYRPSPGAPLADRQKVMPE